MFPIIGKQVISSLYYPRVFCKQVLEACHDEIGHLGIERTTSLLKDRFYWPKMESDIEEYVKTCPRCLKFKAIPEKAELNIINVTRPLELVHIDFLTIEAPRKDKDVNILVVTDHFMRYAQAYITRSQNGTSGHQYLVGKVLCSLWLS